MLSSTSEVKLCTQVLGITAAELAVSLILSCSDYCNIVYLGTNQVFLKKLQRIQNAAGRFILEPTAVGSTIQSLKTLHWLPVAYRIRFKLLLWMYKVDKLKAPVYLTDLFERNTYAVRSARRDLYRMPKVCTRAARKCFKF